MSKLRSLLTSASSKVIKKFCELAMRGRQVGQGFKEFIAGVSKGFVAGLAKALNLAKGIVEFGLPIAKVAAPIIIKHGLPLLLKLFTKGK